MMPSIAIETIRLFEDAQGCQLCDRMYGCRRILSESNGSVCSKVLFVAEAPGRLGAERWGIPLYGDKTGKSFEKLLAKAKLSRADVFITNAVICNPRNEAGLNDRPTEGEIRNCNLLLRRTILTINPLVVVSLGEVALLALSFIEHHSYLLRNQVGKPVGWFGRYLVPLYHTSPRAMIHRGMSIQEADYQKLGRFLKNVVSERKATDA